MTRERVHFTKEKETLLITLYGKALESRSSNPIARDPLAEEAVDRIDYDFNRLGIRAEEGRSVAARAKILDNFTRSFLSRNPSATVLHLGCGLDTRFYRVNPPPEVRWYDVDYPDVIDLRRRLYPPREGYHYIGSSLTELGWIDEIPRDRPAFIAAEGVLIYMDERDVDRLLQRLTEHLPGGELAFDAYNKLGTMMLRNLPAIRKTGADVGKWSIDDPRDFERRVPRLHLLEEVASYDRELLQRFSLPVRVVYHITQLVPTLRRAGRFLRYRF